MNGGATTSRQASVGSGRVGILYSMPYSAEL